MGYLNADIRLSRKSEYYSSANPRTGVDRLQGMRLPFTLFNASGYSPSKIHETDVGKDNVKLAKMCDVNYPVRRTPIQIVLSLKDLDEYIEEDTPATNSNNYRKWRRGDSKAKAVIIMKNLILISCKFNIHRWPRRCGALSTKYAEGFAPKQVARSSSILAHFF